jgi:hypothetical protein
VTPALNSLEPVFARLRDALRAHAGSFSVNHDTAERFGLEAPVGPSTLRAWGGKAKVAKIPIAWVEVRRNYVSYHLMGIDGNAELIAGLSQPLRARMQGKSCFNFTAVDEALFEELHGVTAASLRALKKAGFIADTPAA